MSTTRTVAAKISALYSAQTPSVGQMLSAVELGDVDAP
jgi:hypothetical protein